MDELGRQERKKTCLGARAVQPNNDLFSIRRRNGSSLPTKTEGKGREDKGQFVCVCVKVKHMFGHGTSVDS